MYAGGMSARVAAWSARLSALLTFGSRRSTPGPQSVCAAAMTAVRCFFVVREPQTSAATFCSSRTFHSMYSSMSGWSTSSVTILAARRVVPPLLMAPAARSPMRRKLIRPLERPPPERRSPSPRRLEKLVPVPLPYLNRRASRTHRSMMPPSFTRSSETDWMKQACGWGRSYALVLSRTSPVFGSAYMWP